MRSRTWWLAAAAAGAALAAPNFRAGAQDGSLDYQEVRDAMPRLKQLSAQAGEAGLKLHKLMDALESTQDELTLRELRTELRTALVEYREVKVLSEAGLRPVVKARGSSMTDQQIFEKLRDTELTSVVWENANFHKCIEDLSAALGIPMRLQFRVVQKNKVDIRFQKCPAETILATLCNGFDLRYVIHSGEVVIYKKITPTEERFLDYQKRHPEVKLRYWEREDASGAVDTAKKGGGK